MSDSKTLPALIREASEIANLLAESSGEITPEIELLLELNGAQLSAKIDAYFCVLQELEARAAIARTRAQDWMSFAESSERSAENMRSRILSAMSALELAEISGNEVTFRRQANPPTCVIEDEMEIPGEYITTEQKTITHIEKRKIAADIRAGKTVPGARLERGERLVARPSTKRIQT